MEIKDITNLVQPLLKKGQKLESTQCKRLLSSGENYGSIMMEVQIKVTNEDGRQETINCVAKTAPPPGFLWEVFNTKVTFKKEIALYNRIIPLINNFGRERGIERLVDFVAEPKAARISLDPNSDEADENAVLLMENLKSQGYVVGDRFVGFDLDTAKHLLKDLATLHASVIAYRLGKPDEFKAKVLPHLTSHPIIEMDEKFENDGNDKIIRTLSTNPKCVTHIPKLKKLMSNRTEMLQNPPKSRDIFTTMTHNDYWVNNTMIKYENGKAIANKMVDFQIIEHTSLANDVIFFLYTSVELGVLEAHSDDLIEYYYEEFIAVLKKLGGDISPYTFEGMMEDFAAVGRCMQLLHILFILQPILTLKGEAKELTDMKISDLIVDDSSMHENYSKRLQFVLLDFAKRGWLEE